MGNTDSWRLFVLDVYPVVLLLSGEGRAKASSDLDLVVRAHGGKIHRILVPGNESS